ncbi:putative EF-Hand superfamily protein [Monocercomonoides exilis]|uniref:putative EF-Hand superfamily protein n=1 Tax=Monocercomonoides exilis TaxID=2049356 RepID=UPI00355A62C5|nr:putative EF-Hand superfamily protein [Monocercomonoides exilis]
MSEIDDIEIRRKKILDSVEDYYPKIPASANIQKVGLEAQRRQMIFEAFEFFDTDHNGTLEPSEIKFAMLILGYPTKIDEINKLVEKYGEDGSVDFEHFTDFVLAKMALVQANEEALSSFRLIDDEHKGYVDHAALIKAAELVSEGEPVDSKHYEAIIKAADKDKDGKLNFAEFKKAFLKTL